MPTLTSHRRAGDFLETPAAERDFARAEPFVIGQGPPHSREVEDHPCAGPRLIENRRSGARTVIERAQFPTNFRSEEIHGADSMERQSAASAATASSELLWPSRATPMSPLPDGRVDSAMPASERAILKRAKLTRILAAEHPTLFDPVGSFARSRRARRRIRAYGSPTPEPQSCFHSSPRQPDH